MSKKPTNNDIDSIFRDSLDNLETEPSENFWVKASEDALFKSNQAKKKAVGQWRTVAAALAIALVSLSAYVIYLQKQVSELNKKAAIVSESKSNPNQVIANQSLPITQATTPSIKNINHPASIVSSANNAGITTVAKTTTAKNIISKAGSATLLNKNSSGPVNSVVNSGNTEPENNNSITASTSKTIPVAFERKGAIAAMNGITMGPLQPAVCQTGAPEINLPEDYVKPIENKNLLSKFSISLFYEPYISDELLENDGADNVVVNNSVVSSEEEVNPFVLGARIEYNATSHWSFITGCSFYNFKVSFQPTTIYAQQLQNGDVGYAFQTSVGTVNCPYGSSNPTVGDAMIVKGTYTTNYVDVPLFVKYNFLLKNKWNLYAIAGAQVNIVAYRQVDMYWQDMNWNEGEAKEGISNSSNMYCSVYFAPGVSYKLCKGISIYAEPSLQGPPTLWNKKGIVPNSSIYTGIGTGITYNF